MRCYVLAGGLSSRMGAAKESLTLGGTTFLDRIVAAASAAFEEVVVVSRGSAGARNARTLIEPPHQEVAPLFGIEAALNDAAAHDDEKVWVLAVDYPEISTELLERLRKRFERSDVELLVPLTEGNRHMLCAGYSTALLPRISERIRRRHFVLRELLDDSNADVVEVHDSRALRNVNTPADYRAVERDHDQADASR